MTPHDHSPPIAQHDQGNQNVTDEVEIELCCDGLQQAIDDGAVLVVPSGSGYAEGVLCEDGKTVMQINFCPFCGAKRSDIPAE